MPFAILEKKINALPPSAQQELELFVDFMCFKFKVKSAVDIEKFHHETAELRSWAKEVGMTEQDIADTIKEVRREKREKRERQEAIA